MTDARTSLRWPWPLAAWLGLQLLSLLVSAVGIPLWGRSATAEPGAAIYQLLLGQLAVAAMLFPLLLGDLRTGVWVVLSAWPATQLAGFLSAVPTAHWLVAAAYVSLLLAGLGAIGSLLPCGKSQLLAAAASTVVVLGGPLLWYLHLEFGGGAVAGLAQAPWPLRITPLLAAYAVLESPWSPSGAGCWAAVAVFDAAAVGLWAWRRLGARPVAA